MDDTDAQSVQATRTSFRIVEALKEQEGAGVTDLARLLDLPKSTVHNHLKTLEGSEYVIRDGNTYHVGLRFLQIGERARERLKPYRVARPEIDKLAEETSEMANLLVEEHGRGVFVYKAKGSEAVRLDTHAGKRVHLHTTALGKSILAHLPDERREAVLDRHGLPRRTPNTITDREELAAELADIREQGYAFEDEERLAGLRCVGAPILADEGRVAGSISVSGPASRMKGERFREELPELVTSAANVIEINLTYS